MSETNIVTDVLDVFRAAGFEVRESRFGPTPETIIYGTADNAGVLMESVLEHFGQSAPAAAGIEGLTRYDPDLRGMEGSEYATMDENIIGDYVKFADVERLLGAHAGVVAAEPDEPLTIALGQGLIEIGQGHHGNDRAPALLFGRNGAGKVGVETQGDRVMEPGECIAAVTFENYQSLDVVVEKLGELRARIWPDAPHSQLSYGAAPHFRGYAHLGIGAYVIDHSAAGEPPELAISIATEAQKIGRVVGDTRDNEPGALVQPKDIAVRLRFENVAGLDALEQQLRFVRSEHFADAAPAAQAQAEKPAARLQEEISDRPFSKGETYFEVVILDRSRCRDGTELFASTASQAPVLDAEEVRRAALEEAAKACEGERVEDTGTDGDTGYNNAITHCAAAIRALASKEAAAVEAPSQAARQA